MKLKHLLAIGIIVPVLGGSALLGYLGGRNLFVHVYAQTSFNVKPYVAEAVEYTIVGNKEVILDHRTESRRQDGAKYSTVTRAISDGSLVTFRRVDFTDGRTAMINDLVRAKSTGIRPSTLQATENATLINYPQDCVLSREIQDGQEILFGHLAFRLILQQQPNSLLRVIESRFPDFNCVTLQSIRQTRSDINSAWATALGTRLTSLNESEPSDDNFTNWSNYDEVKPSDIRRRLYQKRGVTPAQCAKCFADEASDVTYAKAQHW